MPPSDIVQFLTWIGSNAAFGIVSSWLLVNWPWFTARPPGQKTAILFGIAAGMGIVSRLAVTYVPPTLLSDLQPYYLILLNAAIIVTSQQLWYNRVELPKLKR